MLVLQRKINEEILITIPAGNYAADEKIVITLVEIKARDRARLGFDADKKFIIDRDEVARTKGRADYAGL